MDKSKKLDQLKDLGYILAGAIKHDDDPDLIESYDILVIHKDWITYSFGDQIEQAYKDVGGILGEDVFFTLEIPTRFMYENQRSSEAPKHDIIFDVRG